MGLDLSLRVRSELARAHKRGGLEALRRTPNPTPRGPLETPTDPHTTDRTREQIESQLMSQSVDSPGPCPLRGGALELGLVSVSKLQARLVRVVRFTMLESLGVCLIYGFMSTRKLRSVSQAQIETPP